MFADGQSVFAGDDSSPPSLLPPDALDPSVPGVKGESAQKPERSGVRVSGDVLKGSVGPLTTKNKNNGTQARTTRSGTANTIPTTQ